MAKRISTKSSLKQVVKQIPEEDLRDFVCKILSDQNIKLQFMKQFEDYFIEKGASNTYLDLIRESYLAAEDKYGFVNFDKQSKLSSKMRKVLETATKYIHSGNPSPAIEICFEILKNNVNTLRYSDDSYGYLGDIMYMTIECLDLVLNPEICSLDEHSRKVFMDNCWRCISSNSFKGWDWHMDMYDYLAELSKDDIEYMKLIDTINSDQSISGEYYQEKALIIQNKIILKWHGDKASESFVLQNLHIQEFREREINKAIKQNDFQRAYQLCSDGIEQDKVDKPGIVHTWHHWMLKAAQKEGNKDVIIKYASLLYIDPFYFEDDFYKILKDTVPPENWEPFVLELAEQALSSQHKEKYADICAQEGWTDKLFDYVTQNSSIHTIAHYQQYLVPKYADEIVELYINYCFKQMTAYNRSRRTYQIMCDILNEAKKIGGSKRVQQAKAELCIKYKNCKALIEELSKI